MQNLKLFSTYKLGNIELKNRIVMAPMTRSRAIGNIPNNLMAEYYSQRADAGLIITEGTSPSPNGLGYPHIPGIFNKEQVEGWKKITSTVHAKGGKIFIQLMHTGRISHPLNLPEGAVILAPSPIPAKVKMRTSEGMQDLPVPLGMTLEDIEISQNEYVKASLNAMEAGFDGVELHGANGYLLEQFISPISNQRNDDYGVKYQKRCRFVIEVVDKISEAIGKDKLGIRLSPYGIAGDMSHYNYIDDTYTYLAEQLNDRGILYIHLIDSFVLGIPDASENIKHIILDKFKNTMILAGKLTKEKAEEFLRSGMADLVAFARLFVSNPDLVKRFMNDLPINENPDRKTFYEGGEKGYTDYPVYNG